MLAESFFLRENAPFQTAGTPDQKETVTCNRISKFLVSSFFDAKKNCEGEANMKKFRGKKRYFKNIRSFADHFQLNVEEDAWYDFWHMHLDIWGLGNHSPKIRREHVRAHLRLYHNVLDSLRHYPKPYQTWICLCEEDTGQDAVYVHTPNPNGTRFPLPFDFVQWGCSLPPLLRDLIDTDSYRAGFFDSETGRIFYVQAKHVDVPVTGQTQENRPG